MKKLITLIIAIVFSTSLHAQDQLITMDDKVYDVQIVDETYSDVTYYLLNDDTKKIRTNKKELFKSVDKFPIPKNTDLIEITNTTLSGDELYRSIGMHLKNSGFTFESTDRDFLIIKTDQKQNADINYWFTASVNNNVIQLRSFTYSSVINSLIIGNNNNTNGTRSKNAGMKNSALKLPFTNMVDIANAYLKNNDATIKYIIEDNE